MSDRRLHPRSIFVAPASAQLRITLDAYIEQWLDTSAVVISSSACACGDELLVNSVDGDSQVIARTARVMTCEPLAGHPTRYRLSLALTPIRAAVHTDGVPVA
jgi:hypothetical protein